jgi:hypothetical protein
VNKAALMKKLADARPDLSEHVEHWALPKEKLIPLDTPNLIKTAADAFETQVHHMTPPQRLVSARNICARAEELDVGGIESSLAYKYASSQLSSHFAEVVGLRKEATAHLHDEELDKLIEVAHVFSIKADANERVKGLDKVAAALEAFDRAHGLEGHWDLWLPDPSYSTYGLTLDPGQEVNYVVKVADQYVSRQALESADWSRVEGKLPAEVIEGLRSANDKLAVFSSLPAPEKELICQNLLAE